MSTNPNQKRFRVALSFPGERRFFVEQVAVRLADTLGRELVLYDRFFEAEFARPGLASYLQNLYHEEADLIVAFLGADYERKEWCGLEWRAIEDLIKQKKLDNIMLIRFDATAVSGLFSTDGCLWAEKKSPEEVTDRILERLKISVPELPNLLPAAKGVDSILLTAIVNPPQGEGVQETSVWLSSTGNQTYIIDSIMINHRKGDGLSMMSGAILPDADYAFTFEYGSRKVYPLRPALALSHEDPRPVSFTLALAPYEIFPSVGGSVTATLHFHTQDGRDGKLELAEPISEAKRLARLIQKDVEFKGIIVTPTGIQRGRFTAEAADSRILYEPLGLERIYLNNFDEMPTSIPSIKLTNARVALNQAIEARSTIHQIIELLEPCDPFPFDLITGLPGSVMSDLLLDLGKSASLSKPALRALTIRHYIWPSEILAKFVLSDFTEDDPLDAGQPHSQKNGSESQASSEADNPSWSSWDCDNAATALAFYPVGAWEEALIRLASKRPEILRFLYLRRGDLQAKHRPIIEKICQAQLRKLSYFAEEWILLFLFWLGWPTANIWSQLLERQNLDQENAVFGNISLEVVEKMVRAEPERTDAQMDLANVLIGDGSLKDNNDRQKLERALSILETLKSKDRLAIADEPKIETLRSMLAQLE